MTYVRPGALPRSVAMTLDSVTARGVFGVLGCRYVSSVTVIAPPVVAAISENCDAIQSRAAKTPRSLVDVRSEKSLRVPKFDEPVVGRF